MSVREEQQVLCQRASKSAEFWETNSPGYRETLIASSGDRICPFFVEWSRYGGGSCGDRGIVRGLGTMSELARAYSQKRQEEERFCFPVTFIWVQGDVGFSFCISQVYPCVSRGTVI